MKFHTKTNKMITSIFIIIISAANKRNYDIPIEKILKIILKLNLLFTTCRVDTTGNEHFAEKIWFCPTGRKR